MNALPAIGDKVIAFDAHAWQESKVVSINKENARLFWKFATVVSLYSTKREPSRVSCAVVFDEEKARARKAREKENVSYGHPAEWVLVTERISTPVHQTPVHGKEVHQTAITNRDRFGSN